jgi:hypothetical protein
MPLRCLVARNHASPWPRHAVRSLAVTAHCPPVSRLATLLLCCTRLSYYLASLLLCHAVLDSARPCLCPALPCAALPMLCRCLANALPTPSLAAHRSALSCRAAPALCAITLANGLFRCTAKEHSFDFAMWCCALALRSYTTPSLAGAGHHRALSRGASTTPCPV